MMKIPARRATRVLLGVGALVFDAVLIERGRAARAAIPALELTPGHRAGAGTPVLLLHGVGSIWRAWSPVLPYLEPHHDVIVPTLPGHGGGPPLGSQQAPSVQSLVDALEDHLDQLGLVQVHIVGNSLGGWLGIELARRGRALSLTLFSPAGAWNSQRSIEARASAIRVTVGALGRCAAYADFIAANGALRWLAMAAQVSHPGRFPAELLAASIRASGRAPAVLPLLRELPQQQVPPLPADRDYPVRLVWSERDRVLPFNGFGLPMLERIPGAELIHFGGVGHVPMTDDPAGVARHILAVAAAADRAAIPAPRTASND
jgi:pimeloyl-ACP methyl ester carboxylesterase